MVAGIILGLMAASLQALSYLFSARFGLRYQASPVTLLVLMHVWIGAVALLAFPFLWHPQILGSTKWLLPLGVMTFSYLLAQLALFQSLRHAESSRVSPLLGLKIMVLAFLGSVWQGEHYSVLQWGAVALCALGGIWLSRSGGSIPWQASGWIGLACVGYALSDLSVVYLVRAFDQLELLHAAVLSVAMSYLLCGLGCLLWWPRLTQRHLILQSTPVALSWLLAMVCLFTCFALLGAVFGGIVQSGRGLISILLGLLVVRLGWSAGEQSSDPRVLIQRLLAAGLMLVAIVLFALGGNTVAL
ncbi:EamA family transporter [Marinobacterium sediminicola]|uniref:EamA-like transporter family protein n=1 Tax=Marinobacterium sediminicola TaxID=518898 RepID=A0ABY1RZA7_9GAMM|nr:EamA family transporter [Marinobacterium sediminicola]ULG69170.1 DMT family transporter [Marinobacterium sediminicola]SMR73548.1 EamA-like transporter family protein [Marinobacterium sediminicola]